MNMFITISVIYQLYEDGKMIRINNKPIKPALQEEEYDCAPTSIKMLMSYYRVPIKSEVRFRNILNTRKDGTSSKNVIKFLSKHFEVEEGYGLEDAKEHLRNKNILLVCILDKGKYSHYVVLTKMNKKYTHYLDPGAYEVSDILKRRTTNYFIKNWREYDFWYLAPVKKLKVSKKITQKGKSKRKRR